MFNKYFAMTLYFVVLSLIFINRLRFPKHRSITSFSLFYLWVPCFVTPVLPWQDKIGFSSVELFDFRRTSLRFVLNSCGTGIFCREVLPSQAADRAVPAIGVPELPLGVCSADKTGKPRICMAL